MAERFRSFSSLTCDTLFSNRPINIGQLTQSVKQTKCLLLMMSHRTEAAE